MQTATRPPSCCAGLNQTLLQGWRSEFPLHPAPFHQMAARSGATPRELLVKCQALQRAGSIEPIRVRWGNAMPRKCWRLAFTTDSDPTFLSAGLAALPGCFRIERADFGASPSLLWAEIEARDEVALQRQLEQLPMQPIAKICLKAVAGTQVVADDELQLAALIEIGLTLCARPYADCAKRLGCSEHRVLAILNTWRRGGQIEGLALRPPPTHVPQSGVLALWQRHVPPPNLLARLQATQCVDRMVDGSDSPEWPWRFSLVSRTTPRQAQLLSLFEFDEPPDVCLPLRIEHPREQAMLFNAESG